MHGCLKKLCGLPLDCNRTLFRITFQVTERGPYLSTTSRETILSTDYEDLPFQSESRKLVNQFDRLCRWKTRRAVSSQLINNIVYSDQKNKQQLIAINKPYGLPNYKLDNVPYSVQCCLPDLATHLQIPSDKLKILKSVDRFSSGITLLSASGDIDQKLKKSRNFIKTNRLATESYLCVVTGHANLNVVDTFNIQLKSFPAIKNPLFSSVHKEPVISSRRATNYWGRAETGEKVRHVIVETLSRSSKVPLSLVNISPSSVSNHLIRVWMADMEYPVLGDGLYDYRSRTVLDHKVKGMKVNSQTNRSQVLPRATSDMLGLGKGEAWRVPAHIHNWRVHLPGWLGKGKDLTILAPPPPHFNQTLKKADITFSFQDFAADKEIEAFPVKKRK